MSFSLSFASENCMAVITLKAFTCSYCPLPHHIFGFGYRVGVHWLWAQPPHTQSHGYGVCLCCNIGTSAKLYTSPNSILFISTIPHHFQAMTAAYLSTSIYLCIQCKLPCNTTPNGLCYLHQHILFVMCKWKLHGSDHFVSIILLCSTTISLAWIWVAVHYLWAQPPHIHGFGYGVAVHYL